MSHSADFVVYTLKSSGNKYSNKWWIEGNKKGKLFNGFPF